MDIREYYSKVFDKLQNSFGDSHYVLAYGSDLRIRDIAQGREPREEAALPVVVEPIGNLKDLTHTWGLEVFIPVVSHNSKSVLSVLDYEIYLDDPNRLYASKDSQWHYFHNYIGPVSEFIAGKLEEYNIPYMCDMTPSGGHFLFWVDEGTKEWKELAKLGTLEEDLIHAYNYYDQDDLKRNPKIKLEAGYVYSGLGKIWEYICRQTQKNVRVGSKEMPLTMSSEENKCVNLDISQYADPAYMSIIRAPFSAHKIRTKVIPEAHPLVDVVMWHYDGKEKMGEMEFEYLIDCMWDCDMAIAHAEQFSGHIPHANEGLIGLIEEYKASDLFKYHEFFYQEPDLERQEAFSKAMKDEKISEKTRSVLEHPNPRAKDPKALTKFVADLIECGWHPKHIGNLVADLYEQEEHVWNGDNWFKYPSRTRANFWARVYSRES